MNNNEAEAAIVAHELTEAAKNSDYAFAPETTRTYNGREVAYRVRIFDMDATEFIVEATDADDYWNGVYVTDDPRHAAAVMFGLSAIPA